MRVNLWLVAAAVNGFLAVACGAFAAHGLADHLEPHALQIFETAARYHMYHALAIGLAALTQRGMAQWAAGLFLAGIVLFSGSLYLLALTAWHPLAFLTPIGGVAFLCGWAALAVAAAKVAR